MMNALNAISFCLIRGILTCRFPDPAHCVSRHKTVNLIPKDPPLCISRRITQQTIYEMVLALRLIYDMTNDGWLLAGLVSPSGLNEYKRQCNGDEYGDWEGWKRLQGSEHTYRSLPVIYCADVRVFQLAPAVNGTAGDSRICALSNSQPFARGPTLTMLTQLCILWAQQKLCIIYLYIIHNFRHYFQIIYLNNVFFQHDFAFLQQQQSVFVVQCEYLFYTVYGL